MNKKTKLILTRIFACILVLILALGIIAPVVASATTLAPSTEEDDIVEVPSVEVENPDGSTTVVPDDGVPEKALSAGFEYVKKDDVWTIQKVAGNTDLGVIVDGLPIAGFDGQYITFFIANLETYEVTAVEVMNNYSFTKSVNIKQGYYVLYANGYAFADSKNNTYAVNGGDAIYFHIGEDFDSKKFPVAFQDANVDALHLTLKSAPKDSMIIESTQKLTVTSTDLIMPAEYKLNGVSDVENPQDKTNKDEDKDNKDNVKEEKERSSLFDLVKSAFSRSILLIVGIVGCFIGVTVLKAKRRDSLDEQADNDKNDDGYVM